MFNTILQKTVGKVRIGTYIPLILENRKLTKVHSRMFDPRLIWNLETSARLHQDQYIYQQVRGRNARRRECKLLMSGLSYGAINLREDATIGVSAQG